VDPSLEASLYGDRWAARFGTAGCGLRLIVSDGSACWTGSSQMHAHLARLVSKQPHATLTLTLNLNLNLIVTPIPTQTLTLTPTPTHSNPESDTNSDLELTLPLTPAPSMPSPSPKWCHHVVGRARERNRIAQRRYRDRQKTKLQESEDKVAELTERLNKVAMEKARCAAEPRAFGP
jgi:hypothetical protein